MSGDGKAAEEKDGGDFELPDSGPEAAEARMRRRVLGLHPADVAAELEARDREIAELKRDVAALWLAFGQHERALGQLSELIVSLGSGTLTPPPGESPAEVEKQLEDLDEVLSAIGRATAALEQTHFGHVSGEEE